MSLDLETDAQCSSLTLLCARDTLEMSPFYLLYVAFSRDILDAEMRADRNVTYVDSLRVATSCSSGYCPPSNECCKSISYD